MSMNMFPLVSGLSALTSDQAAAITASDGDAPTAYTAHASGSTAVTSDAATDLDTTAAALETLRDEAAAIVVEFNKNLDDVIELRTQLNALQVDVAAIRTSLNQANSVV